MSEAPIYTVEDRRKYIHGLATGGRSDLQIVESFAARGYSISEREVQRLRLQGGIKHPSRTDMLCTRELQIIRQGCEGGLFPWEIVAKLAEEGFIRSEQGVRSVRQRMKWKSPRKADSIQIDNIIQDARGKRVEEIQALLAESGFNRSISTIKNRRLMLDLERRPYVREKPLSHSAPSERALDYRGCDDRFQAAMKTAILAGLEQAPIGTYKDNRPWPEAKRYYAVGTGSYCGSPSANCADIGDRYSAGKW